MAILGLVDTKNIENPTEKAKEQFQNLIKQLPAEATAAYIAATDAFRGNIPWLTVGAVVGLVLLVFVRYRAKVSPIIWIMSIFGYVIWVYAIGDGPLQALADAIGLSLPPSLGAYATAIYTIIVVMLALNPPSGVINT